MKRHLTIFKSSLYLFALSAIAIGLVLVPRSTAKSNPHGRRTNSVAQVQGEKGTIVAQLKEYDPTVYGYGFRNYGRDHDNENDLNAGNLVTIFGAENVCESGTTASDCVLNEPAQEWLAEAVKLLEGGHCEGLAVTSLRLWQGLPFDGKTALTDWQSGAHKVSDLEHTAAISNYVAHYHVLQKLSEISAFRAETWKMKPSVILHMLIDSMKDDSKDHYVLSIGMREDGRYTRGHAISPYAVEDMGEGIYHLYVYDSNYPGDATKVVIFDTKEETWRYHTAADPTKTANDYIGDATSQTLGLKSQAARELPVYGCPFCSDSSERAALHHVSAVKKPKKDQVGFALDGEGEYLITDPNGKRIGYDFAKNHFVNEIPDADVVPIEGGMGKNIPPEYHLPHIQSSKPYTINVAGKSIDHEVDADLDMEGPGFVVGFQDILVDPGENLTMTISPNGRELSFTASQDGQTPKIFITIATGRKDPSYFFEIGGIKLSPGKTVTMKLDLEKQKLFFKDNDAKRDAYDVRVTRVNPDGTTSSYEHHDLETAKKTDNYEMDFSKWDGKGEMCFEDDDEGNGFDDDPCTEEPNEKPAKKPAEARNYFQSHQPITALLWY
jgi:hypothetical protein